MLTHCPTIVNQTKQTIVVFQERGILYNKQVLEPGEAVDISRLQTGGVLVPYYIHAVVGDERNLPDRKQSVKNLLSVAAIPTAFVLGALATAVSAGTLAGPSAALAPLVSGMVVNGVVIDTAAIAGGAVVASRAAVVTEILMKKHPDKFMTKSKALTPGKRYVRVTGGLDDGPLKIETIKKREFKKLKITSFKSPTDTVANKIQYYIPTLKSKNDVKKNEPPMIEAS